MHPTDLTVAAVIERDDKFLLVEEYAMGRRVVTQPGGHIEGDESPEQAVEREVLEESGVTVECRDMIGVYLWIHPQTRQQFLRIVFAAQYVDYDESAALDGGILGSRWMTFDDIQASRSRRLRFAGAAPTVSPRWAWNRRSNGDSYSLRQASHSGKSAIDVLGRSYGIAVMIVYRGPHCVQLMNG